MLSDADIKTAVQAMKDVGWKIDFGGFGLSNLRKVDAQPGAMFIKTDEAVIEKARLAAQAVMQYQQYQAGELDAAKLRADNYATEALGGFIQPLVNAPVNIINGVSEPFRAGEKIITGTSYIPEIPRMAVAERSEYWQKDGRMSANTAAEITATIVTGGVAGSKALATQTGRTLLATESAYNIGAGITGKDITQTDKNGNTREMPLLERGLRVTGGVLGARQAIKTEVELPNSLTNKAIGKVEDTFKNPPTIKPQGELITPEGLRIKVPQAKTPIEKINDPKEISISADDANLEHIQKGRQAPYGGTRAREIILKKDTIFVRVHGENNQIRSWMMRAEDIEGLTAQQIKDKFALPELPKYVSDVYVPKGKRIITGKVAPQEGWGKGGSIQYELKDELPISAWKNKRLLK